MADELPKLPHRYQRFVDAYCGEAKFNATKAAIIAGYSQKTAGQKGHELKNIEEIRARIEFVLKQSALSRDAALALIVASATRTDDDIIDMSSAEKSEIVRSSMIGALFSERTTHTTNLAKAYGLFTENINVTGGIDIQIVGVDTDKL